jgi:hypothetical protein
VIRTTESKGALGVSNEYIARSTDDCILAIAQANISPPLARLVGWALTINAITTDGKLLAITLRGDQAQSVTERLLEHGRAVLSPDH